MGILHVFSVYDSKAGFFGVPFLQPSVGQAVRMMQDACADPNTTISRHPGDFTLFKLGTWDDTTARFELAGMPEHIGDGQSFMPPRQPSAADIVASVAERRRPNGQDFDIASGRS